MKLMLIVLLNLIKIIMKILKSQKMIIDLLPVISEGKALQQKILIKM